MCSVLICYCVVLIHANILAVPSSYILVNIAATLVLRVFIRIELVYAKRKMLLATIVGILMVSSIGSKHELSLRKPI